MKLTRMAALAATFAAAITGSALAEYPERPITMIIAWSPGGGTDAVGRVLATEMEKVLGTPITVVNRTGGAGVIGHTEMVHAKPDGYTIGLASIEVSTYYWSGTAQFTAKDVTPLGLVNFDAASVNVPENSPWKNLREALDAIAKEPAGTFKLTGMAPGAGYHLAFSGLLHAEGIDPNKLVVVPTQGAAQGFQELAAGGADVQPSSLPEAKAMIDAGKVRSLAVLAPERLPAFPDVPTVKEAVGIDVVGGAWRGMVAPKGLPEDIAAKLEAAVATAWKSEPFLKFMTERGFGLDYMNASDFGVFLLSQHEQNGATMELLGLKHRN